METSTYHLPHPAPMPKTFEPSYNEKIEILRRECGLDSLDSLLLLQTMFEIHELLGSSVELTTDDGNGKDDIQLAFFPNSSAPNWTVELWCINLTRYASDTCPLYHSSMTVSKDIYDFACNNGQQGIQQVINSLGNNMTVAKAIELHSGKMPGMTIPVLKKVNQAPLSGNGTYDQFRNECGYDNIDDLLLLQTIFKLHELLGEKTELYVDTDPFDFEGEDGQITTITTCYVELERGSSDESFGYHARVEITGELYEFACNQGTSGILKLIGLFNETSVSEAIMRVTMCLSLEEIGIVNSIKGTKIRARL